MTPWVVVDTAPVPGGGDALRLMRRGAEFAITHGATELMNSRRGTSESSLGALTCRRLGARPKLLVGGLGMGFTLRAVLARLAPAAEVVVAELVPAVVAWARGPLAPLFAGSLDDPRTTVALGDVGALIGAAPAAYDAILLDVDNGPGGVMRAGNDALYDRRGIAAARRALRPGGVLSVWAEAPDAGFTARLRHAGFAVEELPVRAGANGRGARHVVWLARRG